MQKQPTTVQATQLTLNHFQLQAKRDPNQFWNQVKISPSWWNRTAIPSATETGWRILCKERTRGCFPDQDIVSTSYEAVTIAKINSVLPQLLYCPYWWSIDQFSCMLDSLSSVTAGLSPMVTGGYFNESAVE